MDRRPPGKVQARGADEIFLDAIEKPKSEWTAFVEAVCGGDDALRRSVFSLLRAHEQTGPFDRLGGRMSGIWGEAAGGGTMVTGEGTGTTDAARFAPGATVGRYEIRERLGAGGMGEAFRAFDSRLHRDVAIKVIARRIQDQPEVLERFEEEARAASALNHPNIVTVHDIGEEGDFPYIVMELVDGQSLRDHLGDESLPVDRIVRLGSQLAGALAAAHERGVVHRDLKPENVVLTSKGIAKILDFGVAQFQPVGAEIESLPTLSAEGIVGTVGYMAPEAMTGRSVDHRSDQFALGAILYEMATGQPCFRRSSAAETVVATLKEEPEPLSARRSDLPRPLVQLVEQCLSKDPGDRFASTWALHKALATVPLATAAPTRRNRAPLPNLPTRFVGRRDELHQIQNLVLESRVRLLTVSGPGGCGKTRLVIEAARELGSSFPGGVLFVSLASLSDPELVGSTIAQAVGGTEAARGRELPDLFAEAMADRGPVLMVLDNFEQVVEAAPLVGELLGGCPELSILVTSREVLRLSGEHDFPLQPLEVPRAEETPPLEELERFPGVALFVERARAADAQFSLTAENAAAVAELCARLDGLPLALELAAVRVRTLSPAGMLERFESRLKLLTSGPRDAPERQRTLRQAIDWSHELLDPAEQSVFQRLAVFSGGFTLEAAEAVADPFGRLDRDVAEIVGSLVDKSLLVRDPDSTTEPRFALLETVREYALERLSGSEDEEMVRKAHAAYFMVLAEEGEVSRSEGRRDQWMERLAQERHNFRAALDWVVARDNAAWALQMLHGLFLYWDLGNDMAEGRRRFTQVLSLPSTQKPSAARAKCLHNASSLALDQGDSEGAARFVREELEIWREIGDRKGQAVALHGLGVNLTDADRTSEAKACYEECLEMWRDLGHSVDYARTLSNFAYVLRREGELDRARQLYSEATALFDELGDRVGAAWEISHEGDVAQEQGELGAASDLYQKALRAFRELKDLHGVGSALSDLGDVARQQGALERATDLYRESLEVFGAQGHQRGVARALEALAVTAAKQDRAEPTLLLAAVAGVVRKRTGTETAEDLQEALARAVSQARTALGSDTAETAWRRGSRLSLGEAVQLLSQTGSEAAEA